MDILINALDDCLEKMQAGATLDEVLAGYPELQEELRLLLQAADAAKSLRYEQPVAAAAQTKSRARFLAQVEELVKSRARATRKSFRSSAALIYGVILGVTIILWTGIASAQALPGDIFYPVKLASENTQLLLADSPAARISLQENFDLQRAQEIGALMSKERSVDVTFAGFLKLTAANQWTAAGISLNIPSPLLPQAEQLQGKYVEITGFPQGNGTFIVEALQVRQFDVTATINSIQSGYWTASRMTLLINAGTAVEGQPFVGGTAQFTIIQLEDDTLEAISVRMLDRMVTAPSLTPVPTTSTPSDQNLSSQKKDAPSADFTSESNNPRGGNPSQAGNPSATTKDKGDQGRNKNSEHGSPPGYNGNPPHDSIDDSQSTTSNNDLVKTPEPGSSDSTDN